MELDDDVLLVALESCMSYSTVNEFLPLTRVVANDLFPGGEVLSRMAQCRRICNLRP